MPAGPLRAIVSRASRHGLVRHATVVMSGSLVAQAIALLAAPVLTRLYAPAAYGAFGVFLSATAILVPISTWALETAIALPRSDARGAHVLLASLVAVAATAALVGVAVLLGGRVLTDTGGALVEIGPFLPLLPLYVLAGGANLALAFWLVRTQRFAQLSFAKVAQSIGTAVTQLGFGLAAAGPGGLILGSLAGQFASLAAAAAGIPAGERRTAARLATRAGWGWAYRTYADFPRLKVPQRLLAAASDTLLIVGLSVAFSPAHAGYYALMRRVLSLPAELVGESVRKALVPRVAETARHAPDELARLMTRSSVVLLGMALLPAAALVAAGPFLFGLVFGPEWTPAGEFARVAGVMVTIRFAVVPYLTGVPLLRLNLVHLGADALRFAATAGALAVASHLHDPILAVTGFALAGIASDAIAVAAVRRRLAAMARG